MREEGHGKIKVMLVDGHVTLRQAAAFLLDREPEFEAVALAGTLCRGTLDARERYRGRQRGPHAARRGRDRVREGPSRVQSRGTRLTRSSASGKRKEYA